jgi:hypothetical protein
MGDARHQARKSDHNLGNAVDVTHDPDSGCTGDIIAAAALEDSRVTYVIWNRRINSRDGRGWRNYTGTNAHTHHCHISIRDSSRDDVTPWAWASASDSPNPPPAPNPSTPHGPPPAPTTNPAYPGTPIEVGARGSHVRTIQAQLRHRGWDISVDGAFGPATRQVVKRFQERQGLTADGIVGPRTWRALWS